MVSPVFLLGDRGRLLIYLGVGAAGLVDGLDGLAGPSPGRPGAPAYLSRCGRRWPG